MRDKQNPVKVEIFDPVMCCSTGVCGPSPDNKLVRFSVALDWLRNQGIQVERYNPAHHYDAFTANATVVKTVNDCGIGCLPLILVNGQIVSHSIYPSKDELAALAGLGGGTTALRE